MYSNLLLGGILYPAVYEFLQMIVVGFSAYLSDLGNYVDLLYIWGSVGMSIVHITDSPYRWWSQLLILFSILLATRRLFNYLRIFNMFSPIVTMLSKVFLDLGVFTTFYGILCFLLSLNWSVL
jgi:hypothetical protein